MDLRRGPKIQFWGLEMHFRAPQCWKWWNSPPFGNAQAFPQNKKEGSIYYKKDFEGHFEKLKSGWDTLISEIQ